MRKFSQTVLSMVVAFILFATAISLPMAPAHAQDSGCMLGVTKTLNAGETCTLEGATDVGTIGVTARVLAPTSFVQQVRIRTIPTSIPSDCRATFSLNDVRPSQTLNCTIPNRATDVTVENVENEPPDVNSPVSVVWTANTR